ncbi:metallophosphoesterase family protein [Streptococcus panodentis]|uniref:Serine/threonine protein phosphatase n=1 Tax=Streptococcus panodentis TaxID=1581472 RepID=A0ABS5AYG2_9STRE|nr:metallophosphoesterase family protein [Streptococcus panodentis]MBP2621288.1 serine/threonine protein phosphatase [Streptococcus panodentis]
MTDYFAIGDVHGKAGMLDELLQHWDGQSQLVFLGDLIDRGEDSRAVLERVKGLVDQKGAICLSGNHEYMFLTWLDNPEQSYDHYRRNGGDMTINSLLGRALDAPVDGVADAERVRTEAAEVVAFIRQMPFILETERYIFVHAGLDLSLPDWHDTSDYQKVWIRAPFHEGFNRTSKIIVFGHTPTFYLLHQAPGTDRLWMTEDHKIGMDGGAVYGGVLHGVLFGNSGIMERFFIKNDSWTALEG